MEDIRFHVIHVDNEPDAKKVEAVIRPYLEGRGLSEQAEIERYAHDGEWIVELKMAGGKRPNFGAILVQKINDIRYSGGGYSVNANMKESWKDSDG